MRKRTKDTISTLIILALTLTIGLGIGIMIVGGDTQENDELTVANAQLESEISQMTERNNRLMLELKTDDVVEEKADGLLEETFDQIANDSKMVAYTKKDAKRKRDLKSNTSKNVFRNLTKVSYMDGLNATFVKAPQEAIGGKLEITLDINGVSSQKYPIYTYNVTVGYSDCKIDEVLDRDLFPHKRIVDLSKLNCTVGIKNVMDELKAGARVAIYHAMDNGITYDGHIDFYK